MCMDQNRDQVPECLKLPLIASLEKLSEGSHRTFETASVDAMRWTWCYRKRHISFITWLGSAVVNGWWWATLWRSCCRHPIS
ncbi:hypothetical protein HZ326_0560 [Fusarium oxysporum f. sp. albedinis]|nr:hypothetical protein HZ326_0560 [Fusarium oxysporum f. sp. albedinis]